MLHEWLPLIYKLSVVFAIFYPLKSLTFEREVEREARFWSNSVVTLTRIFIRKIFLIVTQILFAVLFDITSKIILMEMLKYLSLITYYYVTFDLLLSGN